MTESQPSNATRTWPRPRWHEWPGIGLIAIGALIFLPIVVHRATVSGTGDVQVFFRAGWAIWTGYRLYEVIDSHGWSYHYPPTFALFMGPFSDPMPGFPRPDWALPFAFAVGLWYAINVAAILYAAHLWAVALERLAGGWPRSLRDEWWSLRLRPLLALLPFLCTGLARGQPTGVIVLLATLFIARYANRRAVAASPALAAAIAIKIFPAALALIPLLRGDLRTLLAIAAWSALLLFALPAAIFGVDTTIDLYAALWDQRLAGFAAGTLPARIAPELSPWSNDMVAVGAMLARTFSEPSPDAPYSLPAWASLAQLAFDMALVAAVVFLGHRRFWRFGSRQPDAPFALLLAAAILLAALPAMLPVSQPHYWGQATPLFAILMVEHWRRGRPVAPYWLTAWAAVAWLAFAAAELPIWQPLRDHGLTTLLMLVLVAAGLVALGRQPVQ